PLTGAHSTSHEEQHWLVDLPAHKARHLMQIRYRGELAPLLQADERGVLAALPPMASERGTYLPGGSGWYPELGVDVFSYRVTLDLPVAQRGLVPGRLLSERVDENTYRAQFEADHPAEGIELIAGPYAVEQRQSGAVALRTYFHPEIAELSSGYLDAAAGYVSRYSQAVGAYPYAGFSIASSPLPTGFGMPSLTYLGIDVLRLPFIRTTSLGHEVL